MRIFASGFNTILSNTILALILGEFNIHKGESCNTPSFQSSDLLSSKRACCVYTSAPAPLQAYPQPRRRPQPVSLHHDGESLKTERRKTELDWACLPALCKAVIFVSDAGTGSPEGRRLEMKWGKAKTSENPEGQTGNHVRLWQPPTWMTWAPCGTQTWSRGREAGGGSRLVRWQDWGCLKAARQPANWRPCVGAAKAPASCAGKQHGCSVPTPLPKYKHTGRQSGQGASAGPNWLVAELAAPSSSFQDSTLWRPALALCSPALMVSDPTRSIAQSLGPIKVSHSHSSLSFPCTQDIITGGTPLRKPALRFLVFMLTC